MRRILSPFMFLAGLVGNATCQTTRGVLNVTSSLFMLSASIFGLFVGSLQLAAGGKSRGLESCSSSWRATKSALFRLCSGLAQIAGVITLVTPLFRGAQAFSEKLVLRGVYSPNNPGTTPVQMLFGINSWEEPEILEEEVEKAPTAQKRQSMATHKAPYKKKQSKPNKKSSDKDWETLAERYIGSSTSSQADAVRISMATRHPFRYLSALKVARSFKKS